MYDDAVLDKELKIAKSLDDKELAYYANQNLLHLVSKKWISLSNPQKERDPLDVVLVP